RNQSTEAAFQWSSLPSIASWMFKYWRWSTEEGMHATARAMAPIVTRCVDEHEHLMNEAGAIGMIRRTGYLRLYRNEQGVEKAIREDNQVKAKSGVVAQPVDRAGLVDMEPHLKPVYVGGIFLPDPCSVADPGALGKAYGDLFVRRGGALVEGE